MTSIHDTENHPGNIGIYLSQLKAEIPDNISDFQSINFFNKASDDIIQN